jgi:hypothetical protein
MRETAAARQALLERCHANYAECLRVIARLLGGAIEEEDGAALIATGLPAAMFNPVMVFQTPAEPRALIERARYFYGRRGLPWLIRAAGTATAPIAQAAAESGLHASSPVPGMLLDPLAGTPPVVPGFEIRPVADERALDTYLEVLGDGFGIPREMTALLFTPAWFETLDCTFYLGYLEGEPVATGMRFTSHGIAGVYNISTLPGRRKRGLGEAITWRSALDGLAEGCVASSLQASEMGFPIYARMGFRHVVDYQTWDS